MMNPEQIANSTTILAIARLSMVLSLTTIGLIFWLYTKWQEDKLNTIRAQVTIAQNASSAASAKATDASDRLIAVEARQVQDAAAGARFQSEMLGAWTACRMPLSNYRTRCLR
ncbi:MAG TPA: hypothetical protein VFQ34_06270 [Nitrospiraceae bacterium]|nr:hypothetical protein [Nitrospiraceae bacterium]